MHLNAATIALEGKLFHALVSIITDDSISAMEEHDTPNGIVP